MSKAIFRLFILAFFFVAFSTANFLGDTKDLVFWGTLLIFNMQIFVWGVSND